MFSIDDKDIANMQNKVRLIRQTLGIGITDFANLLGVSRQTVYNIENNKSALTKTQYLAILSVVNMALNEQPEKQEIVDVIVASDYNRDELER